MPVLYNSKRLLPVHQVNIEKEYTRGESGRFRRVLYVVTVNGHLCATKGSPREDGSWWSASGEPPDLSEIDVADYTNRLAILRNKKGALSKLFETRGKFFEIVPHNGTTSIRFIPRVRSITFQQGSPQSDWLEKIPYTIVLETDAISFGGFELSANENDGKWDVDETWDIQPNDDRNRTYKVTHSLSASGHDEYKSDGSGELIRKGWLVAKEDKVMPNLAGLAEDSFTIAVRGKEDEPGDEVEYDVRNISETGVSPEWLLYNYVKTEVIDETNGRYSLTETWILYDGGKYLEDYTVSTRISADDGGTTVTVEGTITGFNTGQPPGSGDRYVNAALGWGVVQSLLITRAQTYSGVTLNASVIGKTVGKNPAMGVITYSYEFSDKPTSSVSGAISDIVTVNDSLPVEVIAKHVCVLREIGPVLQDVSTRTESRRNLTIEVQMPRQSSSFTPGKPNVESIITENTPTATYSGPYVDRNEEVWTPKTGRYTRTISWLWV